MEHGLLFELSVYLIAAIVCVPIAAKLRLGSVLGYLVAGCLIGPFGLRFVRDVKAIMHFSEFGVVLMLFLIGLELDPSRLWSMRRPVFGGGSLQLATTGIALTIAGIVLGLRWQAAFVAGLALALSSTAIAVQTLRERAELGSPMGRSAFSILLFQDIAAIPLIAIVPLLSGGTSSPTPTSALKIGGAIAAVVVLGRYATRPLLRMIARTGLREIFTAFALLLVVGIAQIMASAGLSMALGAFLAGVLLAGSEYRHALETDIEPFKGLLMGLFFIAVGMSIDFGLLRAFPVKIGALVVGLVALKIAALLSIAGSVGVTAKQRLAFAMILSQGGEFAFVVFGVATDAKLLPGQWDQIFTLVVALSMAMTPLLLLVHDRLLVRPQKVEREADVIEHDGASVIIAGFGRFGQIIGRLLAASGIKATLLDHDPDQITFLEKFGFRVFYGDATRLDLLHAAGADHAKLIVVALDDVEASKKLVEIVREHFPRARIVARARNVTHYLSLRDQGVQEVERETFESALRAGRRALEQLGFDPYLAREWADRFRRHNVETLEGLLPHLADEARRLTVARAARAQLEKQFAQDLADLEGAGASWTAVGEDPAPSVRAMTAKAPPNDDIG
jgi:glutathione-regulated potassium-efflux system ancillary protein KefC